VAFFVVLFKKMVMKLHHQKERKMCDSVYNVIDEQQQVMIAIGSVEDAQKFSAQSLCKCTQCKCLKNGKRPCCEITGK
jgi:hypothetical protein